MVGRGHCPDEELLKNHSARKVEDHCSNILEIRNTGTNTETLSLATGNQRVLVPSAGVSLGIAQSSPFPQSTSRSASQARRTKKTLCGRLRRYQGCIFR